MYGVESAKSEEEGNGAERADCLLEHTGAIRPVLLQELHFTDAPILMERDEVISFAASEAFSQNLLATFLFSI